MEDWIEQSMSMLKETWKDKDVKKREGINSTQKTDSERENAMKESKSDTVDGLQKSIIKKLP